MCYFHARKSSAATLYMILNKRFFQGTDKVGLGVMEINQGSGAEIPIPVLADVDEPIPPPTTIAVNGKRASKNIPTISVTKAPAPRPVDLPTAQDIAESPSPPSSFDGEGGDLEAGHGPGLPPQDEPSQIQTSSPTRRPIHQPKPIDPVPHVAGLGFADVRSPPADATTPLVRALSDSLTDEPVVAPTDLLADSVRTSLDAVPIEPQPLVASGSTVMVDPSQSLTDSPKLVDAEFVLEGEKDVKDGEESDEEGDKEEEEEEPPATTIRLIGGGGTAGVVPIEPQSSEDSETVHVESAAEVQKQKDADTDSIKSVDSSSSAKQKGHKKTKSALAGLKRFSQFGGTKKKGSVSSVKSDAAKEG